MNRKTCHIVEDLLPLYHDGICSEESKEFVEEHLKECPSCAARLKELEDTSYEEELKEDTSSVLQKHYRKERSMAWKAGFIIACLLLIPAAIVLLISIADGTDFKEAFTIIATLLIIAGCTALPLMTPEHKLERAVLSAYFGIIAIIFINCYEDGWNIMLAYLSGITLAFSLPFMPVMLNQLNLKEPYAHHKGLLSLTWDTLWLFLLVYVESPARPLYYISTAALLMILPWLIFLIIRYVHANGLIKAALITASAGIYMAVGNLKGFVVTGDHIYAKEILIGSLITAAVLLLSGLLLRHKHQAEA
jgi:MFS family permease